MWQECGHSLLWLNMWPFTDEGCSLVCGKVKVKVTGNSYDAHMAAILIIFTRQQYHTIMNVDYK